jgi:hypothetical protein
MIESLHKDLAAITGFAAVSSQPNSGKAGIEMREGGREGRREGGREGGKEGLK